MSNEADFNFFCSNCKYGTNRKSNMDKHNKTEKHKAGGKVKETFSQETYECKTCNYKSGDRSNFARHLKSEVHRECVDAYIIQYKEEFSKNLRDHMDIFKKVLQPDEKEILMNGYKQKFICNVFERFAFITLLKSYNKAISKEVKKLAT